MILIMMIVVLRYIAHQKGSYYTHEEALVFKSDPEVQVPESPEDPEEGKSQSPPFSHFGFRPEN